MGACHSTAHSSLDVLEESPAPRLQGAASIESPLAFWSAQPRVVLANKSDYSISYWVVQEDKKRTTEHLESIVSSIGVHLNLTKLGVGATGDLERKSEETAQTEEGVYFLMRDHRMGPGGSTQPTHVPFPAGCQDLRVYGFFKEENGQRWQRFKDKVYSIAREQKKYYITALTSNIVPYADMASETTINPDERARRPSPNATG